MYLTSYFSLRSLPDLLLQSISSLFILSVSLVFAAMYSLIHKYNLVQYPRSNLDNPMFRDSHAFAICWCFLARLTVQPISFNSQSRSILCSSPLYSPSAVFFLKTKICFHCVLFCLLFSSFLYPRQNDGWHLRSGECLCVNCLLIRCLFFFCRPCLLH